MTWLGLSPSGPVRRVGAKTAGFDSVARVPYRTLHHRRHGVAAMGNAKAGASTGILSFHPGGLWGSIDYLRAYSCVPQLNERAKIWRPLSEDYQIVAILGRGKNSPCSLPSHLDDPRSLLLRP